MRFLLFVLTTIQFDLVFIWQKIFFFSALYSSLLLSLSLVFWASNEYSAAAIASFHANTSSTMNESNLINQTLCLCCHAVATFFVVTIKIEKNSMYIRANLDTIRERRVLKIIAATLISHFFLVG